MRAIALVLAEMGHHVSGSDLRESPALDRLRAAGITVHVGHSASYVEGVDAVTSSTAIPARNIELVAAARAGIPVLRRAGMLASICACARSVAVAGTHGKTTTTSMLAMMLLDAGLEPSFLVGGDVNDVGAGAHWSGGPLLVVEADESDGTFLELPLWGTILTNVETDHLDHFGSFDAIVAGVRPLPRAGAGAQGGVRRRSGRRGAGVEARTPSPTARRRRPASRPSTSRSPRARSRSGCSATASSSGGCTCRSGGSTTSATPPAPWPWPWPAGPRSRGRAPGWPASAGWGAGSTSAASTEGITLVDDYAHLPSEIAAVLDAARHGGDGWERLVAVFQPNRYSRMALLSPEYRDAFVEADLTVITDIYPSGEAPQPGVTGELVVDAVRAAHPDLEVVYVPRRTDLVELLASRLRPGDVCVSMGCGDVASLPSEVLARLTELDAGVETGAGAGPDAGGPSR